ncbi:transposase [Geobacillus proteiniphilus]|uniref:Transposase n=1 Tax=Geobacillus proteiniphilus TaxID=860353 RepID=A0ABY9MIB2_9BACL|nr:transposase [Geobacillus proteiniphilus]WMJ16498.1 transposase [Geobacillus proteiniphilus]
MISNWNSEHAWTYEIDPILEALFRYIDSLSLPETPYVTGRPPVSKKSLLKCFFLKTYFSIDSLRKLVRILQRFRCFQRACGLGEVPHLSTFSRAAKWFREQGFPVFHAQLLKDLEVRYPQIVLIDSTALRSSLYDSQAKWGVSTIPIKLRILVFVHRQKHGILSNEHSTLERIFFMEKQMKAWIQTIRQLFSPEELTRLARKTGFIRRQRSLTAEAFLTLCAWGDGSLAKQSLQRLCAALTLWHGCSLSSEGLNQRFTDRAVAFLREVFFLLLLHQRPLLLSAMETYRTCFTRLRILDSTSFLVPADYGEDYRGSVSSG